MPYFYNSIEANTLQDLLIHELKDVYDAELQIIETLPKMADAASNSELSKAFKNHFEETKNHVMRLEDAFSILGVEPSRQTCDGMKGLLKEGAHVLQSKLKGSVKDSALIAAAQRVEHYEIAAYGCIVSFAKTLGHNDVAELLQQTLDEEGAADKSLSKVASTVNEKAPAGVA